jgi:hypothetical protein
LTKDVDEIYAAKGTKVVHVDLRTESLNKEDLAGLLLGPTGNLRAPAVKLGRKLVIGFNEPTYKRLFSQTKRASE